jgi:heptosyltransferase III
MQKILFSRTDSIGDVALTLPACIWIKEHYSSATLVFLGKEYTKSVVEAFQPVGAFQSIENLEKMEHDERMNWLSAFDAIIHVFPNKKVAQWAKDAKIKWRIGTAHRAFHLFTCNHKPFFTRKNSDLHESQLNFQLLKPLGCSAIPNWEEIQNANQHFKTPNVELPNFHFPLEKTIILHPKSQGSAVEWPLEKYVSLAKKLVEKGFYILFTGTQNEGAGFRGHLPTHPHILDISGQLSLSQLMALIGKCHGLVACSTGPYHLAGLSGILAVGLFSPRRPIHPGRWKALGKKAHALVFDPSCEDCNKGKLCRCIENITEEQVLNLL